MNKYDIIISPILTEKSYDGIAEKKYTFKVACDATKTQIKVAVEDIFGVPFCLQGFLPPPLTSVRVKVHFVPCLLFAN